MSIGAPRANWRRLVRDVAVMGLALAGGVAGALLADVLHPWLGSPVDAVVGGGRRLDRSVQPAHHVAEGMSMLDVLSGGGARARGPEQPIWHLRALLGMARSSCAAAAGLLAVFLANRLCARDGHGQAAPGWRDRHLLTPNSPGGWCHAGGRSRRGVPAGREAQPADPAASLR
jgi:hypothetical protein